MYFQFIGELRHAQQYPELKELLLKGIASQKLSTMLFIEETIDSDKLKREYLLYSTGIKNIPHDTVTFNLNLDCLIYDQSGNILSLDITKLKPSQEVTGLLLSVSVKAFLGNIRRSIEYPSYTTPTRESKIFWSLWESLKNLKEINEFN